MERHDGMERHDDTGRSRTGRTDEGPASPEQTDEGFETGFDQAPDTEEEQREPNFARGIAHEEEPGTEHHGRFSEGQEDLPETPEKTVERRFSEGIEESPTSE
jgi:hypothetical protein